MPCYNPYRMTPLESPRYEEQNINPIYTEWLALFTRMPKHIFKDGGTNDLIRDVRLENTGHYCSVLSNLAGELEAGLSTDWDTEPDESSIYPRKGDSICRVSITPEAGISLVSGKFPFQYDVYILDHLVKAAVASIRLCEQPVDQAKFIQINLSQAEITPTVAEDITRWFSRMVESRAELPFPILLQIMASIQT